MPPVPPSGTSTQVLVTYLNGEEARGGVENFNPRLPAFFLQRGRGERGLRVAFEEVKTVAVADPAENEYKDALIRSTRLAITEVVATAQDLSRTILEFYGDHGGQTSPLPAP